ncbi:DUF1579 family protein [Pedobacter sp. Hv1]|uniref:DUF1579 family protein n=1 Tax=Pedobacter sp. Hv1 TaxID=1740090 RepID=UPI0006D8B1C2|nr:DUF1579 family protein [Pedobacter sp. Hv1]KQC00591.1 hypothetical protein AQF98_07845 [Pedobacter sp. Hv1]
MKQNHHKLSLLQPFIGKWSTTGKIYATHTAPEIKINGYDTYEWLPGGKMLLHKVNVYIGLERVQSSELINYDKLTGNFKIQYIDTHGKEGSFIVLNDDKNWTFIGKKLRFNGNFSNDNNELTGNWEQSENGTDWKRYMEIKLVKD